MSQSNAGYFNKLDAKCYIDKSKRFVPFIPETDIKLEPFNENTWNRKFPRDLGDVALEKLKLTNIGIYSIATPLISKEMLDFVQELCALYNLPDRENMVVTETNGGLGGFSIRLASVFNALNIVEIIPQHAEIIKNNLEVYGFDKNRKIKIYNQDYLSVLSSIQSDIIICDPPWGGYNYAKQKSIKLGFNNVSITCIINFLLKNNRFKIFILMAPKNFDIQNFISMVDSDTILIRRLRNHYLVAIIG